MVLNYLQKFLWELIEKLKELFVKATAIKNEEFKDDLRELFKVTNLQIMDELWTEHLESMTDLREGIGLRGYAQRDPLVPSGGRKHARRRYGLSTCVHSRSACVCLGHVLMVICQISITPP